MNKSDIKHNFVIFVLSLIILSAVIGTAAADTSVAWTKDVGDVTAADMSEDGSVIYAAVGSQVFVYDSAGVQQNTFSISGNIKQIVCTDDGSKAALYTDSNTVYYINNGEITWTQSLSAITDIDISNVGNVLIVEGTIFHKYLSDGTVEYDSASGTFSLGVIDPNDEFAIVQSGNSNLQKYILSTTNQYWGKINNQTFNTAFVNYQNLLILYTDPSQTNAIIISKDNFNEDIWEQITTGIAVSDPSLTTTGAYNYYDPIGIEWSKINASVGWSGRTGASTWVFDGKMWLAGGLTGNTVYNDVWSSLDGITWTQVTSAAGWGARFGASSWVFNGKMWIAGGRTGGSNYNDVWSSSDGITWTRTTSAAGWDARLEASSWVFNGKMWIAGGSNGGSVSHDVWSSSDGITWTQATNAAGWSARRGASSEVFNGKMWIAGGGSNAAATNYNDVWSSSDGITWTRATSAAGWSVRRSASSGVFNGKMWIAGGQAGSTNYNDVWSSSDGITWTRTTSAAGWDARYGASSWVYDGTMWIAGGRAGTTYFTDIWCSTNTYLKIQPASSGTTYVFYNFTGTNPQHTQTTYNNAVDFSGTYSLQTKPLLSIYSLQSTKTLTGNIQAVSLSDRGDWLGTATNTNIYHDQITNTGFGTEYSAGLDSTGTVYDVATANSAAMSVLGQGQITDIYSMSASRVGTYTAGGAVNHVDIADKNALWAASGGEDGKVYVFSKDASSNWYLEYSSDSENPITALRMSARGEYVLAGRTNSLTLYQTNTPEVTTIEFWFTLYAYKDSDSYRNAAVNVSVYQGNQWNSFAQGLTDSAGKYVILLTAGQTYKFDVGNGQKVVVVMASPSVQSQTVNIHTSPISEAISYEAKWNDEINGLDLKYNDNSGQTNSVTVKVQRTDTWETVYKQTFTDTQNIDEQLPIVDDTTSYKVQFSANRVSGTTRNTFVLSSSRDIIPIPLDQNIKNVLFSCFLIVLAGLFSYMSAIRGALVVAFSATLFVYLGWLTIPWHWLIIAIVIAIVAGFTQRRG